MTWLTRTTVGIALAGIAGAAILMGRRCTRRRSAAPNLRGPATPAPATAADADQDDKPLLSPAWFTLSHFGMLVILVALMAAGLAVRGVRRHPAPSTWHVHGGDAGRGRHVLGVHGCGGCHVIPGVGGATGQVGPPLAGFAQRMFIGGQLPNTPDNLIAWLQNPQRYAPGTAMPNLPISEPVARDMAAYLYARP